MTARLTEADIDARIREQRLEADDIICNYRAAPEEEGFTAAGALRLGVAEMTRFGMQAANFETLAQLMADVIARDQTVQAEVNALRRRHLKMRHCFEDGELDGLLQQLHRLIE